MSVQVMTILRSRYPHIKTKGFNKSLAKYVLGTKMWLDEGGFEYEPGGASTMEKCVDHSVADMKSWFNRVPDGWMWGSIDMLPAEEKYGLCRGKWWANKPILVAVEIEVHHPLPLDKLRDYTDLDEFCVNAGIGFGLLRVDRYGVECLGDPEWFEFQHPDNR